MPWLLSRLIIGLDGGSNLAAELRLATGPEGVRDPERLSLTLLGVMTYAVRAGCRPEQVRRFADFFVGVVLGETDILGPEWRSEQIGALLDGGVPLGI